MLSTEAKEALGPLFTIANKCRLQLLKLKYLGNRVYCPCCGSRFREFARFGDNKRRNAWCPECESLERHRLLWMYFEEKTNLFRQPLRLLHIAPEAIFFHHFKKQQNIEYYPADKFPQLYPPGTRGIDILNIEFAEESFDAIICNHVFQYIEEDRKAMRELYRVLKKGGWAIMQVPLNQHSATTFEDAAITDPKQRQKAFGLKEHVRYYGADYADRLKEAGFRPMVTDYTATFSEEENFKYGFWKGDAVYYCQKD